MKLQTINSKKSDKLIKMLIANKGKHIYYVEFTDELLLSKEKFGDGNLVIVLDEGLDIQLGEIIYVGEL